MTRRQLLAAGGGAFLLNRAALSAIVDASALAPEDPQEAARDEGYWWAIRRGFVHEGDFLYLNHGGICPTSNKVLDSVIAQIRFTNLAPAYHVYRKEERQIEDVRKRMATLFGCGPDEIAVMPNASQGLFTSIMGSPARPDDLFVSTDQDYPRVETALHQRERRDGIRYLQCTMPAVPKTVEDLTAPFDNFWHAKPKFVALPRVGFLNGTLFPTKLICDRARRAGAITLVDGAHGIGHLNENPQNVGSDMYACCLHKWILGPLGTGFFYVRKDLIKSIWSLYPSDPDLEGDIRKFEQFGTRNTGIPLAITAALDAHEAIGMERKAARLQYLREYWTSKLADQPKIHLHSSLNPDVSRVLTTIAIDGIMPALLADWLFKKHRIFVTTAVRRDIAGIRVTPQVFTSLSELDRLAAALVEAANSGIG